MLSTESMELLNPSRVGMEVRINEVPKFLKEAVYSVDIEHDERGYFVCCGFFDGSSGRAYVVFDLTLLHSIAWNSFTIAGHNVKSDLTLLRQWGLPVPESQPVFDTQLYAHILDSSRPEYGLKSLAKELLGLEYPSYDEIVGKHKGKSTKAPKCPQTEPGCCGRITLDKQPRELVANYNAFDCYATFKLYELLKPKLQPADVSSFIQIEQPVSLIFEDMETRGIRVDLPYLRQLQGELEAKLEPLEAALTNELGPLNLDSPKQLLGALNAKGVTPIWRGKPSTDKRALENVKGHSIVQLLLAYRELETLLSSFVYPYLERNQEFIHPFFNQCGTRTGRLSCSNPNLLQIPRRTDNGKLVRKMFIARQGMLLGDCDFGQIEPRILAHLSKDPDLCDMFNHGLDFHDFTSANLGINRERAKILNLSVGYRATWKSVKQQLRCSQTEAQAEIDKWWSLFPVLRRYQDKLIWETRRSGFFTTLMGRRIKCEHLDSSNQWKREAAERQVINNIAQGSAAELMKLAMINVNRNLAELSTDFGLLIQVYDELVFESSNIEHDFPVVKRLMENCKVLDVPIAVDGGTGVNWAEAK